MNILDAGCGEGFVVRALRRCLPHTDITGLDLSEEAIQFARENVADAHFMVGDINHMPFCDNYFDVVLCSEVLEHLEDPVAAIMELLRVSKKSLIITVPHEPWFCLGNFLVLKNVKRLGNPVDHINHWTYRSFQKYMKMHIATDNGELCFSKSFPWSIVIYSKE